MMNEIPRGPRLPNTNLPHAPYCASSPPQVLTGTSWAGQPAVDGAEHSGREWLLRVEGGAGHPESQLVCPSEESEPRPPPRTWRGGGGGGGEPQGRPSPH